MQRIININYICIIGLFLYLYLFIIYYHHIPGLVYINGILYHTNTKSILFRYNDIITNIILSTYCNIMNNNCIYWSSVGVIGYITNEFGIQNYVTPNKHVNQILHVLMVHIPFFIAMIIYLDGLIN